MSNTRNQYYKNTDQRIQKSMLELLQIKEIEQITVNEICSKADINRSSFYAHYENIYDLMDKMEQEIELGISNIYENTDISLENFFSQRREEYLALIIRFVGQHKDFYQAYLKSHQNDLSGGRRILFETSIKPYFKLLGLDSEKDMMYHLLFFYKGILSVIQHWLNTGCEETPEYISHLIWKSIIEISKK